MKRTSALLFTLLALPVGTAGAAIPTGNLVANPGFEEGPTLGPGVSPSPPVPKWTSLNTPQRGRVLRYLDTFYGVAPTTAAGAGCRGYTGPNGAAQDDPDASVYQDYTLPTEAAGKTLRFGALLGRAPQSRDYGRLTVQFLGQDRGTVIDGSGIDNQSGSESSGQELTRKVGSTVVPSGATFLRTIVSAVPVFPLFGRNPGPVFSLVDDVSVTFDSELPADPAPGCRPAKPTTGDAGAVAQETAQLNGTIDTGHEDVEYRFRFGTSPDTLNRETPVTSSPAADAPTAVTAGVTGLAAGTTYSYRLVTRTVLDGVPQDEVPGEVKTFTTTGAPAPTPGPKKSAKHNRATRAITISKGCVKKGRAIRVAVADEAEGTRKLKTFRVRAAIGKRVRTTLGPVGKSKASLKVRLPRRGGKKKVKLSVRATFGGLPGVANSGDSVTRRQTLRFCK